MLGFGPICSAPICEIYERAVRSESTDNREPVWRRVNFGDLTASPPLDSIAAPETITVDKWHAYERPPLPRKPIAFPVCDYPFLDQPTFVAFGESSNWSPRRAKPVVQPSSVTPPNIVPELGTFGESNNWLPPRHKQPIVPDCETPFVEEQPEEQVFGWLIEYLPPVRQRRSMAFSAATISNGYDPIPNPEPKPSPFPCPYRPSRPDVSQANRSRPDQCERD